MGVTVYEAWRDSAMIDLTRERPLSIVEAVKHLPRQNSGKRVHVATVYRWIAHGISGVKLEAVRIGGRSVTSVEAIQRFADRCTEAAAGTPQNPTPPTLNPRQQRLRRHQADRVLDEAGI